MINVTEIIQSYDRRPCSLKDAIRKEIHSLEMRKVSKVILRSSKLQNENVVGGRFGLSIKDKRAPEEIRKASFVVQSHMDSKKRSLAYCTSPSQQYSTRVKLNVFKDVPLI